jgi:hypothetical protein
LYGCGGKKKEIREEREGDGLMLEYLEQTAEEQQPNQ